MNSLFCRRGGVLQRTVYQAITYTQAQTFCLNAFKSIACVLFVFHTAVFRFYLPTKLYDFTTLATTINIHYLKFSRIYSFLTKRSINKSRIQIPAFVI